MSERKLATVRKITSLRPIEGADRIETALVDGWEVVVQKGEFKPGQLIVYLEIDSWVPTEIASFLSKGKEPRVYMGIRGERLRTIKLKGQISQGLILPFSVKAKEGEDVTDKLGIVKYDKEVSQSDRPETKTLFKELMRYRLFRFVIGNRILRWRKNPSEEFPSYLVPKTDEERIQNLTGQYQEWANTPGWSMTEKIDGQSATYLIKTDNGFFKKKKTFMVCSRNVRLVRPDNSNYWDIATKLGMEKILDSLPEDYAIQGEIIGPSVQGNPYKVTQNEFYVFNVIRLKDRYKLSNREIMEFCTPLNLLTVPHLFLEDYTLPPTVADLLKFVEGGMCGYSVLHADSLREGFVVRKGNISFKVISNKYLLEKGE